MKKIFILLVISTSVFVLSSCSMMFFKIMGINPKPETPESVLAFCKENNVKYNYLFMPVDDSILIKGPVKIGETEPFNKNKQQIFVETVHGTNGCPTTLKTSYQLDDENIVSFSKDDSYFWGMLNNMLLIDKNNTLPDLAEANFDFYLVTSWAKFAPNKHNFANFNYTNKCANIDSSKNVCIILLDYDFRSGKSGLKEMIRYQKKHSKKH